jgi:signal transduction histidine kinase
MKGIKIFGSYIRSRIKMLLGFVLFIALFLIVYYLYNLPLEPIMYSCELVFVFAIIFGGIDFKNYYKKNQRLVQLSKSIHTNIDKLPKTHNRIENDYQDLIRFLHKEQVQIISKYDNKESEMIDYYTRWVHQIKTPISGMRLLLQEEEMNRIILEQELFKIEQYVEMVLQYLRLDYMQSDLLLKDYSLLDIVKKVVKKHAIIFIHKKITLNLEEMNDWIVTDEKWLEFSIEQIISNALKYTNQGSISIYMDKDQEKNLIIEDTGVGIKKEDIERIFEKGFTGFNGRMDKKSSGIGLYLSEQVLRKLGHRISVTSELGKGTKVKINLNQMELNYD